MIDPIQIWVLYFSCGCVRWRTGLTTDDAVQCEHSDAYVHAIERKIVDAAVVRDLPRRSGAPSAI